MTVGYTGRDDKYYLCKICKLEKDYVDGCLEEEANCSEEDIAKNTTQECNGFDISESNCESFDINSCPETI